MSGKKYLVLAVVMLALCLAYSFLISMSWLLYSYNDENTVEHTATVKAVDILNKSDGVSIKIYTAEFDWYLSLSPNIADSFTEEELQSIQAADTIAFRMKNMDISTYEKSGFGRIYSLKVDGEELLTLEEYNNLMKQSMGSAKVAGVMICVVFSILSVVFFLKYRNKRLRKRYS